MKKFTVLVVVALILSACAPLLPDSNRTPLPSRTPLRTNTPYPITRVVTHTSTGISNATGTSTSTGTPTPSFTPTRTFTPGTPVISETPTATLAFQPTPITPNSTLTLQAGYNEIDSQFQEFLKANIAFSAPETVKLNDTFTIELLLNPSLSQGELATHIVERGDLVTSTAQPGQLVNPQGGNVSVNTEEVEITKRMKADLISADPDAFGIKASHVDPEQVVSSTQTTVWRWSITAKKEGTKTLELVLYQLMKYDGKEFWPEVETYKANIVVKVTPVQRLRSVDWKWLVGILVTLLVIPAFWRWYDNKRKTQDNEVLPSKGGTKSRRKSRK